MMDFKWAIYVLLFVRSGLHLMNLKKILDIVCGCTTPIKIQLMNAEGFIINH